MRSMSLWAVGIVVVGMLGLGVYFVAKPEKAVAPQGSSESNSQEAEIGASKTACDIFTEEIAKKVLGASATKTELPSGAQVSNEDISVTNCLYDNGSDDVKRLITANVLVRGAKNRPAYATNQFGYEDTKKSATNGQSTVEINGIGDAAWFNPALGQINIFVNDGKYWIIAQAGGGVKGERALGEKLARAIVENL